jgi:hypothetical protein
MPHSDEPGDYADSRITSSVSSTTFTGSWPAAQGEQFARQPLAHGLYRLAHGSQFGVGVPGQRRVLGADDGHVVGTRQPLRRRARSAPAAIRPEATKTASSPPI